MQINLKSTFKEEFIMYTKEKEVKAIEVKALLKDIERTAMHARFNLAFDNLKNVTKETERIRFIANVIEEKVNKLYDPERENEDCDDFI